MFSNKKTVSMEISAEIKYSHLYKVLLYACL